MVEFIGGPSLNCAVGKTNRQESVTVLPVILALCSALCFSVAGPTWIADRRSLALVLLVPALAALVYVGDKAWPVVMLAAVLALVWALRAELRRRRKLQMTHRLVAVTVRRVRDR